MKAKLVNEALEDIFKGPTEEEIQEHLEAYDEAAYKIDKFMDEESSEEYYDILDCEESEEEKIEEMINFLGVNVIDEDRMYSYFPEGGNIKEFAMYIVRNNNG